MIYLRNNKNQLLIIGLLLSITFISHPFIGIKHDGVLYFLQSLKISNPSIFDHDIFFLHGSQDQYTLFSNVYTFFIRLTSAGTATAFLQFLGLTAWTLSVFFLAKSFLPLLPASLMSALAVTLSGYYGSHQVFSYVEPYLTARLYAEVFSIFALGLFLREKYYLGGLFYLLALINHPLITLPALFIGIGLALNIRMWLFFSFTCLLFGIVLGEFGVKPFTGLVQTMDPNWFNYNIERSPFVFLQKWEWRGFSQLLFIASIAWFGYRFIENERIKNLSLISLITLLVFFIISYIGASIFKLPLIISLQLPRVLWICLIINLILLFTLFWENINKKNYTLLFSLLLFSCIFADANLKGIYAILFLATHLLLKNLPSKIVLSKSVIIFLSLVFILPLIFHFFNLSIDLTEYNFISDKSLFTTLLSDPIIAIFTIAITYYLANKKSIFPKITCVTILFLYSILALSTWYNSNMMDFQESAETYYDSPIRQQAIKEIKRIIPKSSTIYWVNSPRKSWFWLQRANYVSFDQGAGSVFNKENTIELMRRAAHVKNISDLDSEKSWAIYSKYKKPDHPKILTRLDFEHLCSDPILNFIITENYESNLQLITFQDPLKKTKFGIYDCHNSVKEKK